MRKLNKKLGVGSILLAASICATAIAAPPTGYYDSLNGKSGVELKRATKELTFHHTEIDYGNDTWNAFELSDTRDFNGSPIWWDMYSNDRIKVSFGHASLNIEHAVPNSWWGGLKNFAYKDLFHLNPSNSTANNQKGNYPLGEIASVTWTNDVTTIGTPKAGLGGGSNRVFEPLDYYKGDFARAYFYIFTTYDNIQWAKDYEWMYEIGSDLMLQQWAAEMLLRWAADDPVSQKEYDRNEVIYTIQKNRNPFIDCPELAEHIWGSKSNVGFAYAGDFTPAPDPDLGDDEYDDLPTMSGYWEAVTSIDDITTEDAYCLIETTNYFAMSYKAETKNKYMYKCDIVPEVDVNATPILISASPEDMAIITLVPSGNGYAMKISDSEGKDYGFLKSTAAKAVTLTNSSADNGCAVTITPTDKKTVINFGDAGNFQYNKTSPRFNTYTSNQGDVMLFKKVDQPAGIGRQEMPHDMNEIFAIFDINGRRLNINQIDMLPKGIYIVKTPQGTLKIAK